MRDTIDMAREAGMKFSPAQFSGVLEAEIDEFSLKAFADLVRADEREVCAQVVVDYPHWLGMNAKAEIANAIRARKTHD